MNTTTIGMIAMGIVPWGTLFYYFSRGRRTNILIWLVMTSYLAGFVGAALMKIV
jgi:hypothetical protein